MAFHGIGGWELTPEEADRVRAEHEDGAHDGETNQYAAYCDDCEDAIDRVVESMREARGL